MYNVNDDDDDWLVLILFFYCYYIVGLYNYLMATISSP